MPADVAPGTSDLQFLTITEAASRIAIRSSMPISDRLSRGEDESGDFLRHQDRAEALNFRKRSV
jgi:hypothetical protein